MAVTLYEKVESRSVLVDRSTAGFTWRAIAIGSDSEAAVYQAAVLDTTVSYFGTLFRSAIRVEPRGGNSYWDVEIDYAPIPPREAIQSPGLDPAAGGSELPQQQAPDPAAPLGPGYGFSTVGGTTRIFQSLKTISRVQSLGAIADGRGLRDHHGAIGVVDGQGAEGVDIVSKNTEFQIDLRRGNVTLNYIRGLSAMTGSVNDAVFYGFKAGEVLFLGAEARYSANDLWQITYKFAFEPNRLNLVISRDVNGVAQITIPGEKQGWDYVWVQYYDKHDVSRVLRPESAYVERVYDRTNFALLEIGA